MEIKTLGNITLISASEGKYLHKIGSDVYFKKGNMLPNQTIDDYEEVDEIPKYTTEEYKTKVKELVREKYDVEEELAIRRKAFNTLLTPSTLSEDKIESVMAEYTEYNTYVEECKVKAVELLNNKEDGEEIIN